MARAQTGPALRRRDKRPVRLRRVSRSRRRKLATGIRVSRPAAAQRVPRVPAHADPQPVRIQVQIQVRSPRPRRMSRCAARASALALPARRWQRSARRWPAEQALRPQPDPKCPLPSRQQPRGPVQRRQPCQQRQYLPLLQAMRQAPRPNRHSPASWHANPKAPQELHPQSRPGELAAAAQNRLLRLATRQPVRRCQSDAARLFSDKRLICRLSLLTWFT